MEAFIQGMSTTLPVALSRFSRLNSIVSSLADGSPGRVALLDVPLDYFHTVQQVT